MIEHDFGLKEQEQNLDTLQEMADQSQTAAQGMAEAFGSVGGAIGAVAAEFARYAADQEAATRPAASPSAPQVILSPPPAMATKSLSGSLSGISRACSAKASGRLQRWRSAMPLYMRVGSSAGGEAREAAGRACCAWRDCPPEATDNEGDCGGIGVSGTDMAFERPAATDEAAHSGDKVAENIAALKALFPEIVTDGRIDFEVLRAILGDAVEAGEERYGLNWKGKSQARAFALTPSRGTLRPAPEDSVDWDTTQNILIEGDNLEVLKLLRRSYAGKVKLIYIDPPYNTGNDFVYPDNYADSLGVWSWHLMVHYPGRNGRMHYGTDSTRQRPHDRGSPSSDTT